MSQELQDLRAALEAERAEHARTKEWGEGQNNALRTILDLYEKEKEEKLALEAALQAERAELARSKASEDNLNAYVDTLVIRHSTELQAKLQYRHQAEDLAEQLKASRAALVLAVQAVHDAQAFYGV
jgi:hypothetical protein